MTTSDLNLRKWWFSLLTKDKDWGSKIFVLFSSLWCLVQSICDEHLMATAVCKWWLQVYPILLSFEISYPQNYPNSNPVKSKVFSIFSHHKATFERKTLKLFSPSTNEYFCFSFFFVTGRICHFLSVEIYCCGILFWISFLWFRPWKP